MVVALEGLVDGEVLLDDLGPAGHRGDRHVVPALVTGVAHEGLPDLLQPGHVREVHVLVRGRVGGLALQQGEAGTHRAQHLHRRLDLLLPGHARGDQHRQTGAAHRPQQVVVGHIRGGHLQTGNAVGGQRLQGGDIPRGAQHVDVHLLAVIEHVVHLLHGQGELGQQVQGVLGAEILPGGGAAGLAVQGVHVPQLELHRIRPGLGGQVHQALGQLRVPLVVVADLRDEEGRVVLAHRVPSDLQRLRGVHGNGQQVPPLIHQRQMLDAAAEQPRQLRRLGVGRCGARVPVGDLQAGDGQVPARVGQQPPAEVPVGQGALEDAVGIHAEHDAGPVRGDLLQPGEHRVLGEDDVGGDGAFDDHWWVPRFCVSSCG